MDSKESKKKRVEEIATQVLSSMYSHYGTAKSGRGHTIKSATGQRVKRAIDVAEVLVRQIDERYS